MSRESFIPKTSTISSQNSLTQQSFGTLRGLDLLVTCLEKVPKQILPNGGEFNGEFHPMVSNP